MTFEDAHDMYILYSINPELTCMCDEFHECQQCYEERRQDAETQKPKYNWRKHLKPKTAPQNILTADIIETEINSVRNILTDIECSGMGITANDVNYHLNILSKRLQIGLK